MGRDRVVDPMSPSITEAFPTDTVGSGSSFWIVPIPVGSAIAIPPVAFERFSVKVSSSSASASSTIVTATGFEVCPGLNVRVPEVPV